jgi:outer membrane protein insertion porin family
MERIFLIVLLVLQIIPVQVYAAEQFYVRTIKVEGLKRVSKEAVLQELPNLSGKEFFAKQTSETIRALFKTGFFKDVQILHEGDVLIIKVVERPSIGSFTLTGIKSNDKIGKILKEHDIVEGRIFDPNKLTKVEEEIERLYLMKGNYAVKVESTVTTQDESRVMVKIAVYEGDETRIKQINIVGNLAFAEKELKKQLLHQKTNFLSWFKKDDRYAKEKLAADLEILRSYYMDRGYINFQVNSTQVSITPDKKGVYVTINIIEGDKYSFAKLSVSGEFVAPQAELETIIHKIIQPGKTFSRKLTWEVKQQIEHRLGKDGFAKAEVKPNLQLNETDKTISIDFFIDPAKRVLVRRINYLGNSLTQDRVLRRGAPQMEGTWISTDQINEGKESILMHGYGMNIDVATVPVPGTDDKVDVAYKMEEQKTAQFMAGIAYSAADKFMFQLGANLKNFLGSGKDINFDFNNGKNSTSYAFGYYDPYFTVDGIGMGFNLHSTKSNLSKTSDIFDYSNNSLGGDVSWTFPVSKYNSLFLVLGYDTTKIDYKDSIAPIEVIDFAGKEGKRHKEYAVTIGWKHYSLDTYIFPTEGMSQRVALKSTMPASDLKYYETTYEIAWFKPIIKDYIVNLSGDMDYAHKYGKTFRTPFYRNYFTGGADSVRGYEERSLGPKDSKNNYFGGNFKVNLRAALIVPTLFNPDIKSVRTALFLDGGQVYDTQNKHKADGSSRNPKGMRYSSGVSLTWNSPLGIPMMFSLAKPLNSKKGDDTKVFAFTFGSQFF